MRENKKSHTSYNYTASRQIYPPFFSLGLCVCVSKTQKLYTYTFTIIKKSDDERGFGEARKLVKRQTAFF